MNVSVQNDSRYPLRLFCMVFGLFVLPPVTGYATTLPPMFEETTVLDGLQDPASFQFTPDGQRLFIGERITGQLRVAVYEATNDTWVVNAAPFYTFGVPVERHRSSGLRGFVFDPGFDTNGYVYAFFMRDNPRHNRVVRIQADPLDPDVALGGSELVLIDLPFNSTSSSGSHNGGDMVFGADGRLYISTGDGWNGGDNVQSLSTLTGKILCLNPDGTIPTNNPFYAAASGVHRAIYCLGLRNPYSMSYSEELGAVFVNDAVGTYKDAVFEIIPSANFGHQGSGGGGVSASAWANVGGGGVKLITGGAWYPETGSAPRPFPPEYHGGYFAAMWGGNADATGEIRFVDDYTNTLVTTFAGAVGVGGDKPVMPRVGPHDGNLYYLLTDYETGAGKVQRVRYTGLPTAETPIFNPPAGQYDDPVVVTMSVATAGASIYYTDDGSLPTEGSMLYSNPVAVTTSLTLKVRAFKTPDLQPSPIQSADYIIGPVPNVSPVANAGPDQIALVNTLVRMNGAASYDPDGSALELGEQWEQVAGQGVDLGNTDEAEAYFTPTNIGQYIFRLTVTDIQSASDSDDVAVTVLTNLPDVRGGLIAEWMFEEGAGAMAFDSSPNANTLVISGSSWSSNTTDDSRFALSFDGVNDRAEPASFDVGSTAMTIACWFNADDFDTHDARFISKASGENDADHYWMLSTLNGDELRFRLKASGTTTTLISPSDTLAAGVWTHIAAVYNGAEMRLYVNGESVASTAKSGVIDTSLSVDVAVGNQPSSATGGDRPFNGRIDALRIYDRALSTNELAVLIGLRTMPPKGLWFASHGMPTDGTGIGDILADPDGDGFINLEEYAYASDPKVSDPLPYLSMLSHEGIPVPVFPVNRLAYDLIYLVQHSYGLSNWTDRSAFRPVEDDVLFQDTQLPAITADTNGLQVTVIDDVSGAETNVQVFRLQLQLDGE